MIKIREFDFKYNNVICLENIEVDFERHKIYGIVGINGAGKTTLLKTISKVYFPNNGVVLYDFGVEDSIFYLDENIICDGTIKSIAKTYSLLSNHNSNQVILNSYLDVFDLSLDSELNSLSRGNQKLAFFSIIMSLSPKVIILDEFLDGLDISRKQIVKDALINYVRDNEALVLIASHTTADFINFCDSIMLIENKTIVSNKMLADFETQYKTFQINFNSPTIDEEYIKSMGIEIIYFKKLGTIVWITVKASLEQLELIDKLEFDSKIQIPISSEEIIYHEFKL